MSVRPAEFTDIPGLVRVAKEGHALSVYCDVGSIDEAYARQFFIQAIAKNGGMEHGDKLVLVSHRGDDITGYFMGFLDRTYQIGDRLTAADIHLFLTRRAENADALKIMGRFFEWAYKNPAVVEIIMGRTDALGKDDGRFGGMLESIGFVKYGSIYRSPVRRDKEKAA